MTVPSVVLILLVLVLAAVLARYLSGPGFLRRAGNGMRRNARVLAVLLAIVVIETASNRSLAHHELGGMPSWTHALSELPVWVQSTVPGDIGVSLFGTIYLLALPLVLVLVPLFLLARENDQVLRRFCTSVALAYALLIVLHLAVQSTRPGLDPGSGISPLLYSDPFWGPISSDLGSRSNSFPSGHVTVLTATVVALWPIRGSRLPLLAFLVVTMIGVLYLGVHWPIDVLGGLVTGAGCGLAAMMIEKRMDRERVPS